MKVTNIFRLLPIGLMVAILSVASMGCDGGSSSDGKPETKKDEPVAAAPEKQEAMEESVQEDVDSDADDKVVEKRKKVLEEAVAALAETRKALRALDEKKTDEALASLEKATGKLELILAREPNLALAPTDVSVSTLDLLSTLEAIEAAKDEAEEALEDGNVQRARSLLSKLGSEIVVSVTNIPLASYPTAIKAVTPLIDDGKIDEAKVALAAALHTLVVTNHVIPLPVIRAEAMLADAEKLTEKKDREEGENEDLAGLLENARYQLQMAEALGYGQEEDYKKFYEQLDQIEKKTEGGKSGKGFFDKIKTSISGMRKSIFQ